MLPPPHAHTHARAHAHAHAASLVCEHGQRRGMSPTREALVAKAGKAWAQLALTSESGEAGKLESWAVLESVEIRAGAEIVRPTWGRGESLVLAGKASWKAQLAGGVDPDQCVRGRARGSSPGGKSTEVLAGAQHYQLSFVCCAFLQPCK